MTNRRLAWGKAQSQNGIEFWTKQTKPQSQFATLVQTTKTVLEVRGGVTKCDTLGGKDRLGWQITTSGQKREQQAY